jgi:hypothetical protein
VAFASALVGYWLRHHLVVGLGVGIFVCLLGILTIALIERRRREPIPAPLVTPLVPAEHVADLKSSLSTVERTIDAGSVAYFGDDGVGRPIRRQAFQAHYPQLTADLDAWDAVIRRLASNKSIVEKHLWLEAERRSMTEPPYVLRSIIKTLYDLVVLRASNAELGQPDRIDWTGFESGWVMPNGYKDAWLSLPIEPDEELESWRMRVSEHTARMQAMLDSAKQWQESAEVTRAVYDRDLSKSPLLENIRLLKHQSLIVAARQCPICQVNAQSPAE